MARLNYAVGVGGGLHFDRFSVTLCTAPLYSNGCWVLMLPALYWAGSLVLMKQFSSERFLQLVQHEKCTHIYLLPYQAIEVTTAPTPARFDGCSARKILSGGAMLPEKTHERLLEMFPNVAVHLLYGQSEGFTTLSGPQDFALAKHGSMGMAVYGADLRLLDRNDRDLGIDAVGELAFHGPGMMKGYYKDPEATAKIVWHGPQGRTYYKTGDFGRIDADGYLYFLGRAQDAIVCDGKSLFSSQLEAVVSGHPQVKEVCVAGVPDEKRGEVPVAFVIPRDGATLTEPELLEWANARLENDPGLAGVTFRGDFPRGSLGKVQKKQLVESY